MYPQPPLSPTDVLLREGDFVAFTFLLTTLAMSAAGFFFLFERSMMPRRWQLSLLITALVPLIAAANYAFMSSVWLLTGRSPHGFRYLDWFLTVPLICTQFYLLLQAAGTRPGRGVLWRLILAAVWMLAAGYVGQVVQPSQTVLWGALSSVGYAVILFEISFGEAKLLSGRAEDPRAKGTFDLLFKFVLLGWGIYPLGYLTNPGNLLESWQGVLNLDLLFNLGDLVNKVGFGLVVWNLARQAEADAVGLPVRA